MNPQSTIAGMRRGQIIEAAVAIIAEQGLQNLSLSEIEAKAGMSRGQLTYYFPTKEDILLAVFDRLLELMYQRLGKPPGSADGDSGLSGGAGWALIQHLFTAILAQPPACPGLGCLQYTFLSQIGHREDFRRRLAALYEEWRSNMAQALAADLALRPGGRSIPPRALATLVQAILHGLGMQAAADPGAFDRQEMLTLCLDVLGSYLEMKKRPKNNGNPANKKGARFGPSSRGTRSVRPKGVSRERFVHEP
jgi:AcrR family transcriptional regulator